MPLNSFYERFDELMQSPKRFVLACHVNPDGDAIGSMVAMSLFLKQKGHEVTMVSPNAFPEFLMWMQGAQDVLLFDRDTEACKTRIAEAEVIIMMDFNNLARSGVLHNEIGKTRCPRVLVDHHRDPELGIFHCAYSDTCVSSASEIVAEIVMHYGFENFDEAMATALMVGIMTDTGAFSHSIYHPRTFELCSLLVKKSMPYNLIHQLVYDTMRESRLRLLGYAINNKMEVIKGYDVAIISLSKSELERFDYHVGDTEGMVNFPLSMKKIRMSVLLTERQDQIRLSFRSKGDFSVHELANAHFKGGGHTNAAGGTLSCSLEQAVNELKSVVMKYDELKSEGEC